MESSGEVADLLVKEGLQATEAAVKLAGAGIKNAAALLLALAKSNYKVVGRTTAKKLAKDPSPAVAVPVKKEDIGRVKRMSKKYGFLYFIAKKKGDENGMACLVSTQSYAANINLAMEELGYTVPEKAVSDPKKANPRAPQESSSKERGSGLNPSRTSEEKPSVRGRLAVLQDAARQDGKTPVKNKVPTR